MNKYCNPTKVNTVPEYSKRARGCSKKDHSALELIEKSTTYELMGEMEDKVKMTKWKKWFDIVNINLDKKTYGYGTFKFRYHFAPYLAFHVINGNGNTYNPTNAKHIKLFKHHGTFKQNTLLFLSKIISIQPGELYECMYVGDTLLFKR